MKNPVFPAIILAERFARLEFLKLRDVRRGPWLAPRLPPHELHLTWVTFRQTWQLGRCRPAELHTPAALRYSNPP
jgi:hypothetical protein